MRRRRVFMIGAGVLLLVAAGWRIYRHFRPSDASWYPPLFGLSYGSVDGGVQRSLDGRSVRIVFHDFGAAHSGNYWTWVIVDNWLTGKRVVLEGYSTPDVRDGTAPLPLRWGGRGLSVQFATGRYGTELAEKAAVVGASSAE